MTKNLIKVTITIIFFAGLLASSLNTRAYPAFLRPATKYGAKDCLFCHLKLEGGEGWNARGQWLISEKERRKADAIDVAWLAEYKEGENKEPDKGKIDEKAEKGDKKDANQADKKEDKGKDKDKDKEKQEEGKKKEKPNR